MNHPDPADWVPYLFGEAPTEVRARLETHLHECPECRARLESWSQVRSRLDRWSLPQVEPRPMANPIAAVLRWAAVVLVAALVGGLAGRWSAPGSVPDRAASGPAPGAAASPNATEELAVALEELRRESDARFLALRRDLETVASTTDSALRRTRQGLALLNAHPSSDLQ